MGRTITTVITVAGALALLAPAAGAQQNPIDTVVQGCKKELETYCKTVTPGEGRVLACLYAYEDKLSGRCEYALYDASAQLEHAIAALTYVANECRADLEKHCAKVEVGEGRLLSCLEKHQPNISARCSTALKDVGLMKK
jgi:hypothetical protein